MKFAIAVACSLMPLLCYCQSNSGSLTTIPSTFSASNIDPKTLDALNKSYTGLENSLDKSSASLVQRMQAKEAALRNKLSQKDSTLAGQLFVNTAGDYQRLTMMLQSKVTNPVSSLSRYIAGIDSMQTAIRFLNGTGGSPAMLSKLNVLGQRLSRLQQSFQNAAEIKDYVSQRETELTNRLGQLNLNSQLLGINKSVFYYQQQLSQYKDLMNDQQQQLRLLSTIRNLPAFQHFWQNNSLLATLLPDAGNSGSVLSGVGLQTRAEVGDIIQKRLGTANEDGGEHAGHFIREQAGGAQGQMNALQQKLQQLKSMGVSGIGNGGDMVLPDFEPNGQKHKAFFQRLEYGFNIQTAGPTGLLPGIATIGLNIGYKLSNKATIGSGVSYLLGMGQGINKFALSSQGIGLRTFLDIKAKGSIWITGGWEWNYMQQFARLSDIRNLDVWQQSALIGLTKKYNIGKRQGNIQILYDVLANRETPRGQPFAFRFGYSL